MVAVRELLEEILILQGHIYRLSYKAQWRKNLLDVILTSVVPLLDLFLIDTQWKKFVRECWPTRCDRQQSAFFRLTFLLETGSTFPEKHRCCQTHLQRNPTCQDSDVGNLCPLAIATPRLKYQMLLTLQDLSVCLVSKTTNLWYSVSGSETSWLRYLSSVALRMSIFF